MKTGAVEFRLRGVEGWSRADGEFRTLHEATHSFFDIMVWRGGWYERGGTAFTGLEDKEIFDVRWAGGQGSAARFMVQKRMIGVPVCQRCEIQQGLGYCRCEIAANE